MKLEAHLIEPKLAESLFEGFKISIGVITTYFSFYLQGVRSMSYLKLLNSIDMTWIKEPFKAFKHERYENIW